MKRFLLVFMALLLCFSVIFTGCSKKDDDQNNDNNNTENNQNNNNSDSQPVNAVNKDVVISTVNKAQISQWIDQIKEMTSEPVNNITTGEIIANVEIDGETSGITVSMKDGYTVTTMTEGTYSESGYAYQNGNKTMSFYQDENGEWQGAVTEQSMEDMLAQLDMFKSLVVPAITAEELTEKDGVLVLANSYFNKLVEANIPFIVEMNGGVEPTEEEKTAFLTEAEETINMLGLEVAFNTGAENISKISVKFSPADEVKEDMPLDAARAVIEFTANGKAIKTIDATATMGSGYGIDRKYEQSLKITAINDGDKVVGANVAVDLVVEVGQNQDSTMEDNIVTYETVVMVLDIEGSAVVNFAQNKVLDVNASAKLDKAYMVTSSYNTETGEETTSSVVEVNETQGDDMKMDVEVKAEATTDDAQKNLNGSLTVKLNDEVMLNATLSINSESAPNFPEIPQDIVDFVNANK